MKTKIQILNDDITKLNVDAIVNAANSTLLGGGGVDGAIHRVAGKQLFDECRTIGGCPTGETRITKAYLLPAKFVIHTVGPVFSQTEDRSLLLYQAYFNSLLLAIENGIKTIAFPNISTGVYRFPKMLAADIAIKAVNDFCDQYSDLDTIIFCCFDTENYQIYLSKI